MNQILATNSQKPNNKPKKEKQPKTPRTSEAGDITKTVRIFAIILLLFGISIIATGSYAIYQSGTNRRRNRNGKSSNIFRRSSRR